MPLRSLRHKLLKIPTHRLTTIEPRRLSINRHMFAEQNLSTISEDIEPLLPDSRGSREISILSPSRLSEDPAISKFVANEEQVSRGDWRHLTRIPVEGLEGTKETARARQNRDEAAKNKTGRVESDRLLAEKYTLRHELNTTQTEFDLHRARASQQIHSLETQVSFLLGTKGWIRSRLRERIVELSCSLHEKEDIISRQTHELEAKDTKIKWLDGDLSKLRKEKRTLERRAQILAEEVGKLERERARSRGDGEARMSFTSRHD